MSRDGLPILTYHAFDTSGSVISTDPAWFAETLAALNEKGYRAVDLGDWIARGRPDVDRGFALAFDDGLRSILDVADVLERHRATATIFLVTDRMGTDNDWPGQPRAIPRAPLLAWSDLDALAAAGHRFAAHGRSHRRLDRCDDATLDRELRGSRDAIEQHTGRPCRLLAYPYGHASPRVRRAAMRHFDAAFGTRLDLARAGEDPFCLSRIETHYLRSRPALDRLLSDRGDQWLRTRRTLRAARRAFAFSSEIVKTRWCLTYIEPEAEPHSADPHPGPLPGGEGGRKTDPLSPRERAGVRERRAISGFAGTVTRRFNDPETSPKITIL